MARYSLDTNTLNHILRKDRQIEQRFRAVFAADHELLMCPVVYYELKRGLLQKDARKQMATMERIVAQFRWRDLERDIWTKAAQGWAAARRQGRTPEDNDLLIAYHAHHFSAILVTANVKHFDFLPVQIENWAAPSEVSL
jgi:predicted nucleic acid-binding protein